jgi:hypothetical protein
MIEDFSRRRAASPPPRQARRRCAQRELPPTSRRLHQTVLPTETGPGPVLTRFAARTLYTPQHTYRRLTTPTPLQQRALELLDVKLHT